MIIVMCIISENLRLKEYFPSALKRKASVFNFLRREERFFRDGLVGTVGLTVEIKLLFQILRRIVNGFSAFAAKIIPKLHCIVAKHGKI